MTEDSFVDVLAARCDAGIRYDERLEQDMIAMPIGPRVQRFATAASPAYLDRRGRPAHPRELLAHACLRGRFSSGAMTPGNLSATATSSRSIPAGPLIVQAGGGADLAVRRAIAGVGVILLFEDWLRPHLDSGALEPVLQHRGGKLPRPLLYYPGRSPATADRGAHTDDRGQRTAATSRAREQGSQTRWQRPGFRARQRVDLRRGDRLVDDEQ